MTMRRGVDFGMSRKRETERLLADEVKAPAWDRSRRVRASECFGECREYINIIDSGRTSRIYPAEKRVRYFVEDLLSVEV